jgi:hypothetical protein
MPKRSRQRASPRDQEFVTKEFVTRRDWYFGRAFAGRGHLRDGHLRGICGTDGITPIKNRAAAQNKSSLTWPEIRNLQLCAKREYPLIASQLRLSLGSTLLQSKAPLCLPLHCAEKVCRPQRPAGVCCDESQSENPLTDRTSPSNFCWLTGRNRTKSGGRPVWSTPFNSST